MQFAFLFAFFAFSSLFAEVCLDHRRLLGIVDYIASDYQGAVQDGNIVDSIEYAEMNNFVQAAQSVFTKLEGDPELDEGEKGQIIADLGDLQNAIEKKIDAQKIRVLCQNLKSRIIKNFALNLSPRSLPSLELGQKIFQTQCENCHGKDGHGNGPAAAGMVPPPRNFHDVEVMMASSPQKFFNVLMTGLEGTAMTSYERVLSEEDMWSVSFYLMSLRHPNLPMDATNLKNFDLAKLSSSTDESLLKELEPSTSESALSYLRREAPFQNATLSDTSHQSPLSASLNLAIDKIQEAKKAFDQNEPSKAEDLLLDAYLDGFEKIENQLMLNHKTQMKDIEHRFLVTRSSVKNPNTFHGEVGLLLKQIRDLLNELEETKTDEDSPRWGEFTSAFVIIVREGFEAFLIVMALLALLKHLGARFATRWVHAGWLSALLAGVVSYYIFEQVLRISGAAKELIEAVCTMTAVGVLFYTGFWLLSFTGQQKWNTFLRKKTEAAVSRGNLWGLFWLAFIAVYREAAETVLFYSALLNSTQDSYFILFGFLAGVLTLASVCFAMMRYNMRLPIRKFFLTTSALMIILAVVLIGKAVHELINAGFISPTAVSEFFSFQVLGVYPQLESILAQVFLLLLGLGLSAIILMRQRAHQPVEKS